jgi:hypothetical protein
VTTKNVSQTPYTCGSPGPSRSLTFQRAPHDASFERAHGGYRWARLIRARLLIATALFLLTAAPATAAPGLSTTDRLGDRRFVTAGSRAYELGAEDARYPASGWHIRGEMGGFWTPPMKMLDGLWFGIDDKWIGPATRFTSGYGHVSFDLPGAKNLVVKRTDFAPDGARAVLVKLDFTAPNGTQRFTLKVDAHSELMSAYPWGWTTPSATTFNLDDSVSFDGTRLLFRETGKPPTPNADAHDWAAVVGSSLTPASGSTGTGFRGPQEPPVVCPSDGTAPPRCDDSSAGKGKGGELRYDVTVPAKSSRSVWFAVAGSDEGLSDALAQHSAALGDPDGAFAGKVAQREQLAGQTRLSLPGDPLLAEGIDWSKQNLADSVQLARDLRIRDVDEGRAYPKPAGTLAQAHFLGAGFPDYPWLFATDGEYTAFAAVAAGQFGPIKDHLRALRDVSRILNGSSGKVVHEVVTDGSVYFGANDDPGNTDETSKFPSAVALVWRWTGDEGFRDEMYSFAKSNLEYVFRELDKDGDNWPEGLGNVERPGMGEEKLDNTVYTIRGLRDLAAMARSKGDAATQSWAESKASAMEAAFDPAWWMPEVPQHADSLDDPGDVKVQQRHWIGVTPMEVELDRGGEPVLGLTTRERGNAALALRETPCYGTDFGLFHTGAPGCDPAQSTVPPERSIFTLNTAIMAVGEGNYGRLGGAQQQRFTTANRRLQLPAPDEQPGAMPEIAPSPDYGRSIDRPFYDRAMVLQAWGNYGTLWPVVHQQLGVRPDLGNGRLEVTPQVPGTAPIAASNVRLGAGSIDVLAEAGSGTYRTVVTQAVPARLTIGHTVPLGVRVHRVTLNGKPAKYTVRQTSRGQEVLVDAGTSGGRQELVVTTK